VAGVPAVIASLWKLDDASTFPCPNASQKTFSGAFVPAGLARCGLIDILAQAEVPSVLRTDTPPQVPWKAIQAQEAIGE
jgi:hypothetical protein